MIGFMNICPHCKESSSFTPEEMECDKALVLWCNACGNFISQTLTLETIRRWWDRFHNGEETIEPPISIENLEKLTELQTHLNEAGSGILERIEIHLKDFTDYMYLDGDSAK